MRLFAVAKQLAGADALELEVPESGTIADLRSALVEQVPKLAPLSRHVSFAMASQYVRDNELILPGAELACIPPVSGG